MTQKTSRKKINETERLQTPIGECYWPKLYMPDKYNAYSISLYLGFNPDAENAFLDKMESLYNQAYRQECETQEEESLERQDPPWDYDKYGRLLFKFARKAGGKRLSDGTDWVADPPIITDSQKMIILDPLEIGNESMVRVSWTPHSYFNSGKAGLSLRLHGVQIIKFKAFDAVTRLGFDVEPGGWRHSSSTVAPPPPNPQPPSDAAVMKDALMDSKPSRAEESEAVPDAALYIAPEVTSPITDDDIPF